MRTFADVRIKPLFVLLALQVDAILGVLFALLFGVDGVLVGLDFLCFELAFVLFRDSRDKTFYEDSRRRMFWVAVVLLLLGSFLALQLVREHRELFFLH
jgi:hypothetical protein